MPRVLSAGMLLAVAGLAAGLSGCGQNNADGPTKPDPSKPQPSNNGGQTPAPTLKPNAADG